jgi:hypothetical protein
MGAGIGILPDRCCGVSLFLLLVVRIEAADRRRVNRYVRGVMTRLRRSKRVQLRLAEKTASIC